MLQLTRQCGMLTSAQTAAKSHYTNLFIAHAHSFQPSLPLTPHTCTCTMYLKFSSYMYFGKEFQKVIIVAELSTKQRQTYIIQHWSRKPCKRLQMVNTDRDISVIMYAVSLLAWPGANNNHFGQSSQPLIKQPTHPRVGLGW